MPGAKYELTVLNTRDGTRRTFSGPPFPDDTWSDYPAKFKVHKAFHWFALSGYSTGAGCADAILAFEGAYKIVRSRVNRETEPKDTKPKEPSCETLSTRAELNQAKPRGVKLDLPLPGLDMRGKPALVNRWGPGQVFTIDPDSNQPVQVNRQRYKGEGRIITSPQGGFVDIAARGRGPGFTVGPGMTIEIKGDKARIIEYDPSGWSTKKTHEFFHAHHAPQRMPRLQGPPDEQRRPRGARLSARVRGGSCPITIRRSARPGPSWTCATCLHCGGRLPAMPGPGRPRAWCDAHHPRRPAAAGRACAGCGASLDGRRRQTIVCGERCRPNASRSPCMTPQGYYVAQEAEVVKADGSLSAARAWAAW